VQSFDDDDLDQVAKFANDTEYGLQASIWTHNLKVAHSLAQDQGGHDLRQHAQLWRSGLALRRLQAVRLGPRDGQGSDGALHRDEIGGDQSSGPLQ
jgi:hypothetical protein